MKKIEAALQLRDHALSILRQHGRYESVGDTKFLMWNGESFGMWLRTLFQKWDTGPEIAAKSPAAGSRHRTGRIIR
jgi:hypothetical protein